METTVEGPAAGGRAGGSPPPAEQAPPADFIRAKVVADRAAGKYGRRVATRFPPEPNGHLHIGHAKSICLNFGIAEEFGGTCNLRFDDTNPLTEDMEYVAAIERDVAWLGFSWDGRYFASDYFERLYRWALELVRRGRAYVDSLSEREIQEHRGTVTEPGRESPYRERSVAENLDLFRRMRAGEFPNGAHVLRAKIDMAAANMKMRDPLLYRIRHARHYRTGDEWPIYPMYDFAHCLSDFQEGITHSLCTLEFENNRELYDWILDALEPEPHPQQIEFARLNLSYTVLSKRRLLELVRDGHVDGWDDPRMPTLSGLRRRGYTPEAIRAFCDRIGVAKANSLVDVAQLEHAVRDDLNWTAPRVLGVLDPLKLVITNYPDGESEELDAPYFPRDVGREGSRPLPFSRELWIEREDFAEDPPEGFHRLAPGSEVRLRYAYFVRCEEVVHDPETGEVVEVRCTYDPETRGGAAPDGRRVRGTLHWVSARHALPVEVRLYDRLFRVEDPGSDGGDWREHLNPESLRVLAGARVEPSLASAEPGDRFQFERQGFFYLDPEAEGSRADGAGLVFNRTVTLRDTWAKIAGRSEDDDKADGQFVDLGADGERAAGGPPAEPRDPFAGLDDMARTIAERYRGALGLSAEEARVLADDHALGRFFEEARGVHPDDRTLASWIVNELARETKERPLTELPITPASLAGLVALIGEGKISGKIAKDVFAVLVEEGGDPRAIVEHRGLEQVADRDELAPAVAEVVAAHPDEASRYRAGETKLLGFFVGQLMRATAGKANPKLANELLREELGG